MYRCPGCGSSDNMWIKGTVDASLSANGTASDWQNEEYDDDSEFYCGACSYQGTVADALVPDPEPAQATTTQTKKSVNRRSKKARGR